jgi:hypothetical protein
VEPEQADNIRQRSPDVATRRIRRGEPDMDRGILHPHPGQGSARAYVHQILATVGLTRRQTRQEYVASAGAETTP